MRVESLMRFDLANLPHDTTLLHQLVRDLVAEKDQRDSEIEKLRLIIRKLQRGQFGRRSERLDAGQLHLGLEELDADIGRAESRQTLQPTPDSNTEHRRPRLAFPDHLPRDEVTLDADCSTCATCGRPLHEIGVTASEMLDWVPASVRIIRIRRPKHGCRSCGTIHQAPAPERLIAKGMATPGLIAQVLVSKYCDHLPLYRQAQIFARHGVELDRSMLANWVGGACWWLEPLHKLLAQNVFGSPRLFADDTPIPVLDPGRGRTKTGRLWVYARDDRPWAGLDPPAAVYFYSPDRKAERPASHLSGFRGVLQVDGYAGFERLTATGSVVLAACWAHVRRRFYEFHQATGSPIAAEALRHIAELYKVEATIRGKAANERQLARGYDFAAHRRGHEALARTGTEPHSTQWRSCRRHPLCPRPLAGPLPVPRRWPGGSRQQSRRARNPACGARSQNHLFAGSDGGGDRWATVCSLIATAKLNGVDPFAYFKDVLARLAAGHPMSRLDELLPWAWQPEGYQH